jgi:hypothetical protein
MGLSIFLIIGVLAILVLAVLISAILLFTSSGNKDRH